MILSGVNAGSPQVIAGPATQWYPGIPYPTSAVPSAMMPTLPTGADFTNHEWINTYDPVTIAKPSHGTVAPNWPTAEQTNCYYIDKFHGSATDTSNTYGYPNKPRLTIPTAAFGSSSLYVEVRGNNTTYSAGNPDYDLGASSVSCTIAGTSSAPRFIVGVNAPRIGNHGGGSGAILCVGIRHIIWDGLTIQDRSGGNRFWPQISFGDDCEYVIVRNCIIRGDGLYHNEGGQVMPISGTRDHDTSFIILYNSSIKYCGDYVDNADGKDLHGFRPSFFSRYIWCVDCEIAYLQGDSIQCANTENTIPVGEESNPDSRPHYIYIANNDFHDNYEQAVDNKNSFHVITSSNVFREFYAPSGPAANATAYILSNNDEGTESGYHWSLFDHVYNAGTGIRDSGTADDEKNYVIGALVHDLDANAFVKNNNGPNIEFYLIDSTAHDVGGDLLACAQPGTNSKTEMWGVLAQSITGGIPNPIVDTGNITNLRYNGLGTIGGSWTQTNVESSGSSLMTDPDNDDYTPQGSALDTNTKHPAYDLFEDMYGMNIYKDRLGTARHATTPDHGSEELA